MLDFDIIVVGGGHAGVEAACAGARAGSSVALVSFSATQIGVMSCNPAMGGLGKGHLIREVDAFDGVIGRAADAAAIHHRMLNASKGAAVQGPRVQADRTLYRQAVQSIVAAQDGLTVIEGEAVSLVLNGRSIGGIVLDEGRCLTARAVILATGTFLGGRMFCGRETREGGRVFERPAKAMAVQLRELGLPITRLKTGTPPRLDGRTIDWSGLERQNSDAGAWTMSALTPRRVNRQLFCAVTRTNAETHRIIREAMDESPLHSGEITGIGPRYCPSIEDKVQRFGDRDGHQIFLEPEGLDDHHVYPNGISTSLPLAAQVALVRSIAGLERAVISQAGYAVEYDHVDPRILDASLQVRDVEGLYLAGQINGTTGYEEAAAQGLAAGLNAAAMTAGRQPVKFDRATSYLGVMIDDLTLQGVTEPYRMLTARAEYRLRLRADNAEARLSGVAERAGSLGPARLRMVRANAEARGAIGGLLQDRVTASAMVLAGAMVRDDGVRRTLADWLRFSGVDADTLVRVQPALAGFSKLLLNETIQDHRYAPYLERQEAELLRVRGDEAIAIPVTFEFAAVPGLSHEMVERLTVALPATLAAASRVRGITPAALATILAQLRIRIAA